MFRNQRREFAQTLSACPDTKSGTVCEFFFGIVKKCNFEWRGRGRGREREREREGGGERGRGREREGG